MGFDNKLATPKASSSKPLKESNKLTKKSSHMCDCNKENRSHPQKENHSSQTDDGGGIDFGVGALIGGIINGVGDMLDGVGPWLPYIGGSALLIMLLGYMAKNVDSFLGMFESDFKNEKVSSIYAANKVTKSSIMAPNEAPSDSFGDAIERALAGQNGGYEIQEPCTLKVKRHRVKWPE